MRELTKETIGGKPNWYKGKKINTRVGIAISTFGALPTAFVRSLLAVQREAMFNNIIIDIIIDETKPLDDSRNNTVRELMKEPNLDYIFFMDADMVFAKETLVDLMKQEKDIITGVYVQKSPPYHPVLRMRDKATKRYNSVWAYPRGSIFKVDACGAGCLLVNTKVFKKLKKPFFKWDSDAGLSEDIYFCEKARKAGYDIWVHGGMDAGHSADLNFLTPAHFWDYYERMNAQLPQVDKTPKEGLGKLDYSKGLELEKPK